MCLTWLQAIEYTPPERQALFVGEIESHVLECVQNANGNHVRSKPLLIYTKRVMLTGCLGHSKDD